MAVVDGVLVKCQKKEIITTATFRKIAMSSLLA